MSFSMDCSRAIAELAALLCNNVDSLYHVTRHAKELAVSWCQPAVITWPQKMQPSLSQL